MVLVHLEIAQVLVALLGFHRHNVDFLKLIRLEASVKIERNTGRSVEEALCGV